MKNPPGSRKAALRWVKENPIMTPVKDPSSSVAFVAHYRNAAQYAEAAFMAGVRFMTEGTEKP